MRYKGLRYYQRNIMWNKTPLVNDVVASGFVMTDTLDGAGGRYHYIVDSFYLRRGYLKGTRHLSKQLQTVFYLTFLFTFLIF